MALQFLLILLVLIKAITVLMSSSVYTFFQGLISAYVSELVSEGFDMPNLTESDDNSIEKSSLLITEQHLKTLVRFSYIILQKCL